MLTPVALGGAELTWRFGRSSRLDQWLAQCPWERRGGALSVRTSGPVQADVLASAIRARVREINADHGMVDAQVIRVTANTELDGIQQLRSWIGLGDPAAGADALRLTAQALVEDPLVVIAAAWVGDAGITSWDRSLRRALEDVNKIDQRATPVVLQLCPLQTEETDTDLSRGEPIDPIDRHGECLASWDAYVHHRLAWESGGDVDLASEWHDALGGLNSGDDTELERRLDEAAMVHLKRAPFGPDVAALVQASSTSRLDLASWLNDPCRLAFVWSPRGVLEVAPWVARAVLRTATRPFAARARLRASLVCAPIRDAVVGRCVAWEAVLRAQHTPSATPDADTMIKWDRFNGDQQSDRVHYPATCVALPQTPWDVATFGSFIHAVRANRQDLSAMHDVRVLRNAMVHGHYASWSTLQQCDAIARQLARM